MNLRSIKKISFILPCKNEQACIPRIYSEIKKLSLCREYDHEFLFIDDGSSDQTYQEIQNIALQDLCVQGVSFTRNFGKEAAIQMGLKISKGDVVIVMDSDGQHPVSTLPTFIEKYKNGADIVSGVKTFSNQSFLNKTYSKLFNYFFTKLTSLNFENETDFKLLGRNVVKTLLDMDEYNRFFRGLVKWTGYREDFVKFEVNDRYAGVSNWNFYDLGKLAFDAIFTFSAKPLIYTVYLGLIGLGLSVFILFIAIFLKFYGNALSGWASLMIMLSFFSCLILTSIGIVGIYLMKVFQEIKKRPQYLIAEKTIEHTRPMLKSESPLDQVVSKSHKSLVLPNLTTH